MAGGLQKKKQGAGAPVVKKPDSRAKKVVKKKVPPMRGY